MKNISPLRTTLNWVSEILRTPEAGLLVPFKLTFKNYEPKLEHSPSKLEPWALNLLVAHNEPPSPPAASWFGGGLVVLLLLHSWHPRGLKTFFVLLSYVFLSWKPVMILLRTSLSMLRDRITTLPYYVSQYILWQSLYIRSIFLICFEGGSHVSDTCGCWCWISPKNSK